ncbi:MAG: GlsB/YeaQ/YmgE family stress response membrane protein [Caldilinea sp.]
MVNFLVWIIVGGLIGWVASMIMRTNAQQGILLNVVVGIVGAFLAGLLLTPFLGIGTINQTDFSIPAMLVSLGGAVILLGIVNLFRRGRVR